jgi:GTP cyclohydrolase II
MNTDNAYKQKIETELEQFQVKLAAFNAQPNGLTIWEHAQQVRHTRELERKVVTCRVILKELELQTVMHMATAGA